MLLSEGQMSDHKGAALMIDQLPEAEGTLDDKGYVWWVSPRLAPSGKSRSTKTSNSTNSARESKTCSGGSGTSDASTRATTGARTPSCPPSHSPRPSYSRCDQRVLSLPYSAGVEAAVWRATQRARRLSLVSRLPSGLQPGGPKR
jgi:hypothetical protein